MEKPWHSSCCSAVLILRVRKKKNEETAMKEILLSSAKPAALSFECDGCGQFFETWERLRQHQVDCQNDDFESPA